MISAPESFPGANPFGGDEMPLCSQTKRDTLSKRRRRKKIELVFATPSDVYLCTDETIARLTLPPVGQRKARREGSSVPSRRAPMHPKDLTGALARGALNAAAYMVIFFLLYILVTP